MKYLIAFTMVFCGFTFLCYGEKKAEKVVCPIGKLAEKKTKKATQRSPFPESNGKGLFESEAMFKLMQEGDAVESKIRRLERLIKDDAVLKSGDKEEIADRFGKKTKDRPKELTQEELEKIKADLKEEDAKKQILIPEIRKQIQADKEALLEFAEKKIKNDPAWERVFNDFSSIEVLRKMDKSKTVSLLLGNPSDAPSKELKEHAENLAEGLVKKGYTVLYDADSNLGKVIGKAAGKRGVGITGTTAKAYEGGQILSIANPFMRMEALGGNAVLTVTSPDSISGNGLLTLGNRDTVVLDPEKKWVNPYRDWYNQTKKMVSELGVHYNHVPQVSRAKSILTELKETKPQSRVEPLELKQFNGRDFVEFLETADTLKTGGNLLKGSGGAVYFGSSGATAFDAQIEDVSTGLSEMKIPAVTGGAGGTMRLVNEVAFKVGVPSIGIPLGGRATLSTEPVAYSKVHTLTVPTGGYETRIPLLFDNRPLIVMNPGGSGTMREAATVLSAIAADPASKQKILFVGKKYYGTLVDNLLKSPQIPQNLKDRIAVVDNKAEAKKVVQAWIDAKEIDPKKLQTVSTLTPRKIEKDKLDEWKD